MKPKMNLGESKCANGIIIGLFPIYDYSYMVFETLRGTSMPSNWSANSSRAKQMLYPTLNLRFRIRRLSI